MSSRTAFLGKLLGLYYIAVSLVMFLHPSDGGDYEGNSSKPAAAFHRRAHGADRRSRDRSRTQCVVRRCAADHRDTRWLGSLKGTLLLILSQQTESRIFIAGLHHERHPNLYAAFVLLLGGYLTYAAFSSVTRLIK
jgi:hypothetical protein